MLGRFDFKRRWPKVVARPAGEARGRGGLSDAQVLDLLDMIEGRGMSYAEAGAYFGLSRSAVAGLVLRIRRELAASEIGSRVQRAENRDGALGRRWWEAGLRKRAEGGNA